MSVKLDLQALEGLGNYVSTNIAVLNSADTITGYPKAISTSLGRTHDLTKNQQSLEELEELRLGFKPERGGGAVETNGLFVGVNNYGY